MFKQPIRNFRTSKSLAPRFCDVIVDGKKIYLEQKIKGHCVTIPWEDVVYQVQAAITAYEEKLPQIAP